MTSRSYSTPKGIVHDSWILLVDAVDAFFRFLEQLGSHHIPDARGGIRGVAAALDTGCGDSNLHHFFTRISWEPPEHRVSHCENRLGRIPFGEAQANVVQLQGLGRLLWRSVKSCDYISRDTRSAHVQWNRNPWKGGSQTMAEGAKKLPLVSLNFCCSWHRVLGMGMGNNLAALAATTMLEGDLESKNCIWYVICLPWWYANGHAISISFGLWHMNFHHEFNAACFIPKIHWVIHRVVMRSVSSIIIHPVIASKGKT